MIRAATAADVPALVEMGRQFHAMAPHRPMGEFDPEAVARMLSFMVASPQSLVLTNGEGAIGGVMAPVYFNPGKMLMEEAFWWAAKGGRQLLAAFCDASESMGADYVSLSTLDNERSAVIDRVVTRMGFQPVERRYLKGLR